MQLAFITCRTTVFSKDTIEEEEASPQLPARDAMPRYWIDWGGI